MSFSAAAWVLHQESRFVKKHFTYVDPDPEEISPEESFAFIALYTASSMQFGMLSLFPYYQLYHIGGNLSWAADDVAYSAANRGAVQGVHNFAPRTLKFAKRGKWAFRLVRFGGRAIPVVGWAFLAYDLYSLGKYAHEQDWI